LADNKKPPMLRRLRFSLIVLISQILLIALAVSWLVHMTTIAVYGSAYFVENNPYILWSEIAVSILITVFAIFITVLQIQRLGERRTHDRRSDATERSTDSPNGETAPSPSEVKVRQTRDDHSTA
jgi:hypothetical protein